MQRNFSNDLPKEINFNIYDFLTDTELLTVSYVSKLHFIFSKEFFLKNKLTPLLNSTLQQPYTNSEIKEVAIMKKVRQLVFLGADANDYGAIISASRNGH